MYSPKIREDLIPIIYTRAKEKKEPMTKIVDELLRDGLKDNEETVNDITDNEKYESSMLD